MIGYFTYITLHCIVLNVVTNRSYVQRGNLLTDQVFGDYRVHYIIVLKVITNSLFRLYIEQHRGRTGR